MVEFALILPVMLLLILGILDFSRGMNYWNDANQIAADGARFAAVNRNPGDPGSLQEWLRLQADTTELRDGSSSVTTPLQVCVDYPNGPVVGEPVRVRVTLGYSLLPFVDPDATELTIVGDATMRLEQIPTNIPAGGSCG